MGAAAAEWQSRLAAALGGAPTEQKVSRLLETILAYVEAWEAAEGLVLAGGKVVRWRALDGSGVLCAPVQYPRWETDPVLAHAVEARHAVRVATSDDF